MHAAIGAISLFSFLGHLALLSMLVIGRQRLRMPLMLAVLPLFVAPTVVLCLLPATSSFFDNEAGQALLLTFTSTAYIAAFGGAVLRDATRHQGRLWLLAMLVWLGALVVAYASGSPSTLGRAGWLRNPFNAPNAVPLVTVGGFVLVGALLLAATTRAYLRARLPEAANRRLLWFIASAVALMSAIFLISGNALLQLPGILMLSAVNGFYVYLQLSARPVDVRTQMLGIGRSIALVVLGTLITFGTITLTDAISPEAEEAPVAIAILSGAAAVAFTVVELGVRALAAQVNRARQDEMAHAVERWSRMVVAAGELEALSRGVEAELMHTFDCISAAVLRTERTPDNDAIDVITGDGWRVAALQNDSLLYRRLTTKQTAFTQHDLDEKRHMSDRSDPARSALAALQMHAFAPIVAGDVLLGLLAAGPKSDEMPYTSEDLRLMSAFANLTAVALCRAEDASALRALRDERDRAQAQIKALEAVKADFVAVASHELRTPLTQVQGNLELLEALNAAEALDAAQTDDIAAGIRVATERLNALITAMLDVSQIEAQTLKLACEATDLERIVRAAADPLTSAIRQRRISVVIHDFRDLPRVYVDSQRLTQAVRAVLLNAIKFTPDNGNIDISAAYEPTQRSGQPDTLLLTVCDNGVGVEPENLDLIFRKFYRAHTPETHSSGEIKFMGAGPGLGLTIARGIVEAHGGTMWAESGGYDVDACPGTRVFMRLPIVTMPTRGRQAA